MGSDEERERSNSVLDHKIRTWALFRNVTSRCTLPTDVDVTNRICVLGARVPGMSQRLAAYAVCIEHGRVLLAPSVSPTGERTWTLPGGRVEQDEDPFDTVIREVAEETGCDGEVERLLGVDSRLIPAADRLPDLPDHQNIGIFYAVRITGGELRPEPNGDTAESVWTPIIDVVGLRRSSLVDIGVALADQVPSTGHVDPVPIGGLIQH